VRKGDLAFYRYRFLLKKKPVRCWLNYVYKIMFLTVVICLYLFSNTTGYIKLS